MADATPLDMSERVKITDLRHIFCAFYEISNDVWVKSMLEMIQNYSYT